MIQIDEHEAHRISSHRALHHRLQRPVTVPEKDRHGGEGRVGRHHVHVSVFVEIADSHVRHVSSRGKLEFVGEGAAPFPAEHRHRAVRIVAGDDIEDAIVREIAQRHAIGDPRGKVGHGRERAVTVAAPNRDRTLVQRRDQIEDPILCEIRECHFSRAARERPREDRVERAARVLQVDVQAVDGVRRNHGIHPPVGIDVDCRDVEDLVRNGGMSGRTEERRGPRIGSRERDDTEGENRRRDSEAHGVISRWSEPELELMIAGAMRQRTQRSDRRIHCARLLRPVPPSEPE